MFNLKVFSFLGLAAIGLSACGDAQGVSSSAPKTDARTFIADQMKSKPANVKSWVKRGARHCAERKAGGKIPTYVVSFLSSSVMMGIKHNTRNPNRKVTKKERERLVKRVQKKMMPRIRQIAKRLKNEKPDTKARAMKVLKSGTFGGIALGNCTLKYARKAMLETQAKLNEAKAAEQG